MNHIVGALNLPHAPDVIAEYASRCGRDTGCRVKFTYANGTYRLYAAGDKFDLNKLMSRTKHLVKWSEDETQERTDNENDS